MGRLYDAGADGKAQHKLVSEVTRNQVDFFGTIDSFQKSFIQFVGTLKRSREWRHMSVKEAI